MMTFAAGDEAGGYQFVQIIQSTPKSEVYQALRVRDQLPVAIKVVLGSGNDDRLKREAMALNRLQGTNVLRLIQRIDLRGHAALVMPLARGTLRDLLRDKNGLSLEQADAITWSILLAIEGVHKANLVHRDIKPENIFFCESNTSTLIPLLGDFDAVRFLDIDSSLTDGFIGSLAYAAPEQKGNAAQATPQADIYSLSMVIGEVYRGQVLTDRRRRVLESMRQANPAGRPHCTRVREEWFAHAPDITCLASLTGRFPPPVRLNGSVPGQWPRWMLPLVGIWTTLATFFLASGAAVATFIGGAVVALMAAALGGGAVLAVVLSGGADGCKPQANTPPVGTPGPPSEVNEPKDNKTKTSSGVKEPKDSKGKTSAAVESPSPDPAVTPAEPSFQASQTPPGNDGGAEESQAGAGQSGVPSEEPMDQIVNVANPHPTQVPMGQPAPPEPQSPLPPVVVAPDPVPAPDAEPTSAPKPREEEGTDKGTLTLYEDADEDGAGNPAVSRTDCDPTCSNYVSNNTDCDDRDPERYPGHEEVPGDGIDQDCDGFDLDEPGQE